MPCAGYRDTHLFYQAPEDRIKTTAQAVCPTFFKPDPLNPACPNMKPSRAKILDRARALLVLGIIALMPPFALVFRIDEQIFGVPVPLFYLFLVWLLLISGALALASRLQSIQSTRIQNPDTESQTGPHAVD